MFFLQYSNSINCHPVIHFLQRNKTTSQMPMSVFIILHTTLTQPIKVTFSFLPHLTFLFNASNEITTAMQLVIMPSDHIYQRNRSEQGDHHSHSPTSSPSQPRKFKQCFLKKNNFDECPLKLTDLLESMSGNCREQTGFC